ncbi:TNF receptor-associated factor 2-like isoform X2 [Ptychodera flava]|uniref:TNF receptor-associated factor 2-like isoform X2 n=1 Tax=Ptychodera flava TaxID=63121 RepID=UPI00396A7B7F
MNIGGHHPSIFGWNGPDENYLCVSCRKVLRNPVYSTSCGHRYCRGCYEETIRRTKICWPCKETGLPNPTLSVDTMQQDKAIARDMSIRKVVCPNRHCPWKGTFRDYEQVHEQECKSTVVACTNRGCRQQVNVKEFTAHLDQCPFTLIDGHCAMCEIFRIPKGYGGKCEACFNKDNGLRIVLMKCRENVRSMVKWTREANHDISIVLFVLLFIVIILNCLA